MSAFHVRRDKAALFQWVQAPPGDSLQPEATGAGMEETKCLKPSDSGHDILRWTPKMRQLAKVEPCP